MTSKLMKDLTPSQQAIIEQLKRGPASINEVADATNQDYGKVYRPFMRLVKAGYLEVDPKASEFQSANRFRVKRMPNDGSAFIVDVNGEQRVISFNTLLESYARQTKLPKIASLFSELPKAIAMVAAYAAAELESPGTVTEADLLEPLAGLRRYNDALQEQFGLVQQLMNDNRLWEPSTFKTATLIKTDRYLSPSEVYDMSRTIIAKFVGSDNESESSAENESGEADE